MKKLSIITQVILINIFVMALFICIFISQNYSVVSKQLDTLEDEKINSIVKTLEPLVSINLALDLKDNYVSAIENIIKNNEEIVSIKLFDDKEQVIYKNDRLSKELLNTKEISIVLTDNLLKTSIGTMRVYYTFSNIYTELLADFKIFLFYMFILFIISLLILTILIKRNLNPLQILKNKIQKYSFEDKVIFNKMQGNNELVVINNSIKQMVERLEKEVDIRILYEKEIMQKNRLASQGEMLDNIAHQWRQPLMKINAILLNIDRMSELNSLEKSYLSEKISEASNTTYYMSQTIEVFREFVNPNKQKEEFEIIDVINQAINFMNSSLEEVKISFRYKKNPLVFGMKNELIQVFISLFTNSVDIFEQKNIKNSKIDIRIFEKNNNVVVILKDNAGGIKDELLGKIFDPYVTTKFKSGGTGMGLYICKLILANSFNGTINAKNSRDGAIFILQIKGENR